MVEIPGAFALKYINVLFTPSFVLLPLSPPIGGVEVAKIIAVFLVGFLVMLSATAYLVRILQMLLGTSKRSAAERAEEMGNEDDGIPLVSRNVTVSSPSTVAADPFAGGALSGSDDQIASPARDPPHIRAFGAAASVPHEVESDLPPVNIQQDVRPFTLEQKWAASISIHFDSIVYLGLFLFVGLPLHYGIGYSMAAHLALNILAYFSALAVPTKWKRFFHPVLVSSALTILGIWILALTTGQSLADGLATYSTKTRYLQLFSGKHGLPPSGAGDVFASVLDVSIVALALPMFQYRNELKRQFFSIIIPNIAISVASLFAYPALCHAIGISSKRSLSFAARSLTLALATPATTNLGGDLNLVAVLCIMSGILGVLIGPVMLKWLRIPEDDYVTRGITLGGNSSAIATALLLVSDPRAAALSSLSMGLFGTAMVALTSIPPVVAVVRSLVGL
ncbi:hypothetical protein MMC09_002683 [Bachmanniomyces sp. S44760]|nr:hypothetical protein [Bachmanniomyces sp. S44760]